MSDEKQPTITSANLPSPPPAPESAPDIPDDEIIARPLQDPDFSNFNPRNSGMKLRWVNRIHGNEGRSGRMEQARASGFVPCVFTDVKEDVPNHMRSNGGIVYNDIILMKIPRAQYEGALKYNREQAIKRLGPHANMAAGTKELRDALNDVGGSCGK
jgi:hypothetical protein